MCDAMFKSKDVNVSEYFSTPNPGLTSYFDRVRAGQPDEYRTPFYKGKSVTKVVQDWMTRLSPLRQKWPTLYEFEKDLASKVGPLSIQQPLERRMDDIANYYDLISLDQTDIAQSAIAAVLREFGQVRGLSPRPQDAVVRRMKLSTNSGSPYFTKRRGVLSKTVPLDAHCAHALNSHDSESIVTQHLPFKTWKSCAILGWRGQEGGPTDVDVKQRVVWMFPFGVNVCELQVYQPLIEKCQQYNLVPAWVSMEAVDREITALFDTKGRQDVILCTDFSKFDQHFGPSCQKAARTILGGLLNRDRESSRWLLGVFPIKYHIPMMYDYGKMSVGPHGMGSGSGGTNADETLVHRALQYEAAILNNSQLNPHSQCLGDDGILSYPGITVDDVMRAYTSHGLEMNASKQYTSTQDCTYLRRWHHQDYRVEGICVGVYATTRALGRLCEQERYYDPEIWGPHMVALRQLSIIENVKWHPLRDEFVDYCMKGDKYRLGIDIPGFLDNIDSYAKESIEYMPDFLGYTKSLGYNPTKDGGISNWWVVQYLKSKV